MRVSRVLRRLAGWASKASILAAGGCGTAGPDAKPNETVASVIVTNVPSVPLLVGNTVQLAATAVNATGGTIPGASFTWQSSDPPRASVSAGGLVTALDAGPVVIRASAGGKTGEASLDLRAGGGVGPAGGVLTMLNGAVQLDVPAGAVNQTVNVLVRPVPDPTGNPRLVPGTVFELAPEGTRFGRATLSIAYDPARIPAGLPGASLQLYSLLAGVWTQVRGSTVDQANHRAAGLIFSTGTYGVASTAVDHISLSGSSLDGALYTGQTTQLSADLFDVYGAALTGRTVTWSSSDNGRATAANGLVTAVGAGPATITATADGKSAQTTLAVLPRPVADWSLASEWVSYQGDGAHRGYFPVTLDPVAFRERWVKALSGTPLNPVAVGQGAIYITPNSYFGSQQKAWALDLTNGQQRWAVDFGSINGVQPPVAANGLLYLTTSGQQDSYLYALDAATGSQRFRSPYGNQWGRWLAPVVAGSRVHMGGGTYGGLYAFDGTSGAELWFSGTTGQNDGWTPAVDNGLVYAYSLGTPGRLTAFDASSGALSYEILDTGGSFFGFAQGLSPVLGGPGEAFLNLGGMLTSFDLGQRSVRWQIKGQFSGNAAYANGVLYIVNGGQLEARLSSDASLLWAWKPANKSLIPTVMVTKNLVFVKTDDRVYAIDLAARREVWSYAASGELTPSAQGYLFIAGADGVLRAIALR